MRLGLGLAALSAAAVVAFWAWLGTPAAMPDGGPAGKLYCVSYAPFRHAQSPLDPTTHIEPAQIEEDIVRLAKLTDCVRTYSVDAGLDRIPEIAARHGMKVIQGIWLSGHPDKNRYQVETAVALANRYRDVIRALVVGNEVLLRGEMSAQSLAATLREVKSRVSVPVTYADVWEFWLRNRALADAADFITIHILPYWEDDPIAARDAAAHVESIRQRVAREFPGKDIMIGEFGWPSAGRMREGALPSSINQARVIQEVVALAQRENFRVNVIEAFDQPWKRMLEGTVGGHWGLLDDATRDFKFDRGRPVSNHPLWMLQAFAGGIFTALIFLVAAMPRRNITARIWLAVTAIAIPAGVTIGWTVETIPRESLGAGGWLRMLSFCAVALLAPPLAAYALASAHKLPAFSRLLAGEGTADRIQRALGIALIATTVLAVMTALGLAFDPRYRDFPFAPMSGAVVPFAVLALMHATAEGRRGVAEYVAAAVLAGCTAYIAVNETFANWQSLWLCGLLLALALTLTRVRGERS